MSKSYYFLVAGLPDLILDEGKTFPAFADFMSEVQEQVTGSDWELFKSIRLPFDNANLVNILEHSNREFNNRGNYSREDLSAAIKFPETLPQYMQAYLDAHRDNRPLFPGLVSEDQLNWLFFEQMIQHTNRFIREWFTFELDLRNLIAGINSRKGLSHFDALATDRERSLSAVVITRNDVAETILRSNAPDFGVVSMIPWAERVFAAARGSLLEFEKGIDTLRWDMLNELTTFSYFKVETIVAFSIKLLMVERWKRLDAHVGRARFDKLTEELRAAFIMPEGF